MRYILLEYKDLGMSGAAGRVAVWAFPTGAEAQAKFDELVKNDLPLALYTAELVISIHKEEKKEP